MALVNFSNLDFDQIKSSLKEYLRSNSNFTDYDFEGSTLSTLIDVLAYNTYITSYNANMVSNEVFIDSATLRENVVSLARNIGYTPRSRTSARASISFSVRIDSFDTNVSSYPISLSIKKGIICSSSSNSNGQGYNFSIQDEITTPVIGGVAVFDAIDIYEGTYITESFSVDSNIPSQRFILSNPGIDISTIRVSVRDPNKEFASKYVLSNTLFDITPKSKVFFIQEVEDERYELIFGDGLFGKKLDNLSLIEVSYVVSSGELANGINSFSFSGRIFDNNDALITSGISLISTNLPSRGGKEIESVSSIRNYAPRIYASQYRAVTATDYESIIPQIYPETESVSVFGGETLTPPEYGKVFITIKPINGQFIPTYVKDNIKRSLKKYSVAGIVPEILDLKYIYIEIHTNVYYNTNLVNGPDYLKTLISNNIQKYAKSSEMNRYGARFKYSKFLKLIDDTNEAITSNITNISIRRDLRTVLGQYAGYEICYGNSFYVECDSQFNIKSSGFKISGVSDTVYLGDVPDADHMKGTLVLFKLDENKNPTIVRKNAGTIDYDKGEILLYPINIIQTSKKIGNENIVEISTIPRSNDVIGLQDLYLQIDTNNSTVNMVTDTITSGQDISGSTFIFSTSYSNGDIVRR